MLFILYIFFTPVCIILKLLNSTMYDIIYILQCIKF